MVFIVHKGAWTWTWFSSLSVRKWRLECVVVSAAAASSCSRPLPFSPASVTWREAPDTDPTKTIAEPGPTHISCTYKNSPLASCPLLNNALTFLCLVDMKQSGTLKQDYSHYKPLTVVTGWTLKTVLQQTTVMLIKHRGWEQITASRWGRYNNLSLSDSLEWVMSLPAPSIASCKAALDGGLRGRRQTWPLNQECRSDSLIYLSSVSFLRVCEAYSRCSGAPEGLAWFTDKWFIA